MDKFEKLAILADAAKYDVSCASSSVDRPGKAKGIGSAKSFGICHSWAADGRCISLLKILMSNDCIFDCAYCINRSSNDFIRASFEPEEIAELTIEFYRRNYIEGLFLSSGVKKSPHETMEKLYQTLKLLREKYLFHGYIHVKAIPGTDPEILALTGYLADRMSVNAELATKKGLKLLAPQKKPEKIYRPMTQIKNQIAAYQQEKSKHRPVFVPGGQSTQIIVGAAPETDLDLITASEKMYQSFQLKRVYFSAYIPVNQDQKLPQMIAKPPLLREHRLYQADWLLRFYHFQAKELLDAQNPDFDENFDPKMNWALNHLELFPLEVNKASFAQLLRIPGIGVQSAQKIISQRRLAPLNLEDLKSLKIAWNRARFFLTCQGKFYGEKSLEPEKIKNILLPPKPIQTSIFDFSN